MRRPPLCAASPTRCTPPRRETSAPSWRSTWVRCEVSVTTPAWYSTCTPRARPAPSAAAADTTRCWGVSAIRGQQSGSRWISTHWCLWRGRRDYRRAAEGPHDAGRPRAFRARRRRSGRGFLVDAQAHRSGQFRTGAVPAAQGSRRAALRRARRRGRRRLRARSRSRVRRRPARTARPGIRHMPPLSRGWAGNGSGERLALRRERRRIGPFAPRRHQVPAVDRSRIRPPRRSRRHRSALRIGRAGGGRGPCRRDRGPGRDRPHARAERARRLGRVAAGQRTPGGQPRLVSLEARGAAPRPRAAWRHGMIPMLELADPEQRARARALRASAELPADVAPTVARIIADVRGRGDEAVRELTRRFDGPDLPDPFLPISEWDALESRCDPAVRAALQKAAERVRAFHAPQVPQPYEQRLPDGGVLRSLVIPLERVACYVPGGRATYPSTVIMTAAVAHLAGVHDVIVTTPPRPDGGISPAIAAAARIAGATRILRAGGAHAVAAVAIGTDGIPRCDAVVGPGNVYVTEAKRQLSGEVRIDSLAGPTEVVIVADGSAEPRIVAAYLIAQAEHDPLALAVVVTDDRRLASAVQPHPEDELRQRPNAVAEQALRARGAAVVAPSLQDALAFADELAPEHLELLVR